MRKRVTFLFICLFIPSYVYGNYCTDIENDSVTCWGTEGCQYYGDNIGCDLCQADSYCDGNNTQALPCPADDFSHSERGAKSINECYTNISCHKPDNEAEQCRHYYDQTVSNCPTITTPHLESNGGSISCCADTRECKYFGIAANSCTQQNISGTATWHSLSEDWGVGNCECGATTFTDNTTRFCSGTQSGVHPQIPNVDYATSTINYNGTATGYRCTHCILDNGNNKYYASSADGDGCTADLQSGTVCKCETSTYRGHYRKGKCNSNENWSDNGSNICTRIACNIPGTTTTELLPISQNNSVCVFSAQTELRDSDEFTLGTLQQMFGLDPSGWKMVDP